MAAALVMMSTVNDGEAINSEGKNGFPRARRFSGRWRLSKGGDKVARVCGENGDSTTPEEIGEEHQDDDGTRNTLCGLR